MSRALEYAAKCSECKRPMRPGTLVDFIKDGSNYTYIHAGGCDSAIHEPPKKGRERFDTRECSRHECSYAIGVGFRQGHAPARCPLCSSPWRNGDA